jgi:thiol-disulfide isomerase/thioredoxin
MNLFSKFAQGLAYDDFLARYANDSQKQRWKQVHGQVTLTAAQRELLGGFKRRMPVLCLAGAWCGDCSDQCPIFAHFAAAAPVIELRFLDRDDHADAQQELKINDGNRVPVLVFFSEDGHEVARYGERTLSKYRQMVRGQGATGIAIGDGPMLAQVTQDWLNEFERVQSILRLSPRLRKLHND